MDLSWLGMQCRYKYYQVLIYKSHFNQYWKTLDNASKVYYGLSACFGASLAGWIILKYVEKRESDLRKCCNSDCEEKQITRHSKGLPPGLFNEGNTCFVNCIMQALASFPVFVKWTMQMPVGESTNLTVFPSVNRLLRVLTNMAGNEDNYSAGDIISSLRSHGWVISTGQQDAYEFFQILLSTMEEEVSKTCKSSESCLGNMSNSRSTILNKVSKNLPLLLSNANDSPFKGSFANKMTCLSCSYELPVKFEKFESLILSLENISPFGASLEYCLNQWIKPELVHEVECVRCSDKHLNQKYSSFTKQVSFAKLPQCLCIQLQRTYYSSSGATIKNSMYVRFPELLDVQQYTYRSISYRVKCQTSKKEIVDHLPLLGGSSHIERSTSSPTSSILYKLNAAILHFGEAQNGHFVTYKRLSSNPNSWVYISDQMVKAVHKENVFMSAVYLLFYERVK